MILVGGAVVDISSFPARGTQLIPKTSNPGVVVQSVGGVAHNVCEALHRLKITCVLVSAISNDLFGNLIKTHLKDELKIGTEGIVTVEGKRSAVYASMHDERGELLTAVADMDILETSIAVEHFNKHVGKLRDTDVVFLDGNLSRDVLSAICTVSHQKNLTVFHDPTSVSKCSKAVDAGCLAMIDWLKPDESETWEMARHYIKKMGMDRKLNNLSDCISVLVEHAGVKNILVTRGASPVLHGHISQSTRRLQIDEYDPLPVERVVSVTGAGDSFCAGVIFGLVTEQPIHRCIQYGLRASQLSLMTSRPINEQLNDNTITDVEIF